MFIGIAVKIVYQRNLDHAPHYLTLEIHKVAPFVIVQLGLIEIINPQNWR